MPMNRRKFIAAAAALLSHPAIARTLQRIDLRDAYTLWYNRPSAITVPNGFCLGFITSDGGIEVAQLDRGLKLQGRHRLYSFNRASDHGAPALLRIPAGPYEGHVLACFSNHSSELFMCRTVEADDVSMWGAVKSIDEGRCTYVSLGATPDGILVLMYTLQHSSGRYERGQWRETLFTTSADGGETWARPKHLVGFGAGTFPYSTPFALSESGKLATAYALYTYDQKRHMGLSLAVADLNSGRVETRTIVSTNDGDEIIPYETTWHNDAVYITFSRVSSAGVTACLAHVDPRSSHIKVTDVGDIASGGYVSGAALSPDCTSVFYVPRSGGLVQKILKTGHTRSIFDSGNYALPFTLSCGKQTVLGVSKDPLVRNTRSYQADLTIMYV